MQTVIHHIDKQDDPRIAAYQNLADKQLALNLGLFVVEGELLVRRLLDSHFSIHSILMTETRYQSSDWTLPANIPVYLASPRMISNILGFDFHRGVLALGKRAAVQPVLDEKMQKINRLLICPEINDVENLGGIMRTAAALGFEHILLGESCCDPFARRAVRTSMGAVFKLKLYQSTTILEDLGRLKSNFGFELHASVLDERAQILEKVHPPEKLALILGSEAHGVPEKILEQADFFVTIPMKLGTDSLNVGVAAGVLMYHYRKKSPRSK